MPKEITLKDIQGSIGDLKTSIERRLDGIDGRLDGIDGRLDDLHEAMSEHSTEMDRQFREVRTSMATKDYVDDRIAKLRGEFVLSTKRTSRRSATA